MLIAQSETCLNRNITSLRRCVRACGTWAPVSLPRLRSGPWCLVAETLAHAEHVGAGPLLLVFADRLRFGRPGFRQTGWRRWRRARLPGNLLHVNKELGRWCALAMRFPSQRGTVEIRLGRKYCLLPGPEPVRPGETAIHEENSVERQSQRFQMITRPSLPENDQIYAMDAIVN